MADFRDVDVTDWHADRIIRRLNTALRNNPSVEFFRKDGRTIMRIWKVRFTVEGVDGLGAEA